MFILLTYMYTHIHTRTYKCYLLFHKESQKKKNIYIFIYFKFILCLSITNSFILKKDLNEKFLEIK